MRTPRPASIETPLARKLRARIAEAGPISFHDYMEACLYDPDFGYYRARDPIGSGGDFTTAPEISQIFGELIGLWTGDVWQSMGKPTPLRLVELGPGRGTLMADALRALRVYPGFFASASIHLVETSEPLRRAQRTALRNPPCDTSWVSALDDVPSGASIVIANEFFDCLPVRQFIFDARNARWRERFVGVRDGLFHYLPGPDADLPPSLSDGMGVVSSIEDGAIVEYRPAMEAYMRAFKVRASDAPIAALVCDYGYTSPAMGDTAQATREHRYVGAFDAPGETDLTAHVDFGGLTKSATLDGLRSFGPIPMGEWLLRLGAESRVNRLVAGLSEAERQDVTSRAARLINPKQMGLLFKVIALTAGELPAPLPFRDRD